MSAIEELKNKCFAERDAVERAIVAHWEDWHLTDTNVIQAEKAAEEYAALVAELGFFRRQFPTAAKNYKVALEKGNTE